MDTEAKGKVAKTSRQRAEFYLRKGKPGRAFSHFLVALKLNPEWKPELKHLFASTLCTWGRILESKGRYDDLFTCYEQAVETFGDNEEVLNNLGAHLFRMGHLNEACNFFQQALDANHCFLPAHRNLESISNLLVERWHFRMLNDSLRNLSYREAIIKKVRQGFDTVLDIGTGTGILSLFAVEGGAKEVYACDSSQTMINIANEVMEANDASLRVRLLSKLSNDVTVPQDIPHRVSLVVTETLDAGLLGENIMQTLVHAWNSLLLPAHMPSDTGCKQKKQMGIVIPFGATIWVAPIQCYDIARRYRLIRKNPQVSHSEPGVDPRYSRIRQERDDENEESLELDKSNLIAHEDEPYDTQDLNRVRGGFRFLSPARETLHINFNNCTEMTKYLNGTHEGCQFIIKCTVSGCIDAMAAWFELQLDEDLTLSSTPEEAENKAECWDQTVFPLQDPIDVTTGQKLLVNISCIEGKLAVTVNTINTDGQTSVDGVEKSLNTLRNGPMEGQHQNTPENDETPVPLSKCIETLANLDLQHLSSTCLQSSGDGKNSKRDFLPMSQESVMFLNDHMWVSALTKAANELLNTSDIHSRSWNILDLSPFPILGLTLLKGLTKVTSHTTKIHTSATKWDQLTCVVRDERDEAAIRYIAQTNGIDNAHIECIKEEQLEDILDSRSHFDVILVHLVNSRGELKESYINYLPSLRKLLKKNGLLLPRQLSVHCALVRSQWLSEVSRVIDRDRVCGYRIKDFINTYQVSEHVDFWLDSIVNDIYSDIVEVMNIGIHSLANTAEFPLTVKLKVPIDRSGSANAIVYWCWMQLLGLETEIRAGEIDSFANYSAILINPECRVTAGESVELILTCHQGLIHAGLQKNEE